MIGLTGTCLDPDVIGNFSSDKFGEFAVRIGRLIGRISHAEQASRLMPSRVSSNWHEEGAMKAAPGRFDGEWNLGF